MVALHSGHSDAVLAWLGQRTDFILSPSTFLIWATDDLDGRILGAVGAGGRMGRTWGSLSISVEREAAMLPLLRAGVGWFFGQQHAAAGYVTISSKRANWIRRLIDVVGFYQVDRVHRGISNREDLVILKLTPDSCRIWQAELRKLTQKPALEVG